ncbi:ribosomal protein L29 [Kipferlia bialata]|uniref:Ribosomal protein L29 n=1 Tax=Kipferlia bialata TaxID=797122 RepID=A0A9K3D0S5_9EUKA|nr:ribosomal protein L29 [Kipferlia bialata]|eukprot:g7753.t1
MAKALRCSELREMSTEDLQEKLATMKAQLLKLRVQKYVSAQPSKISEMCVVRKDVARLLTVLSQRVRAEARVEYNGKKYAPRDLRPQLTHAMRLRLRPSQKAIKSLRVQKAEKAFPLRRYAIKE